MKKFSALKALNAIRNNPKFETLRKNKVFRVKFKNNSQKYVQFDDLDLNKMSIVTISDVPVGHTMSEALFMYNALLNRNKKNG